MKRLIGHRFSDKSVQESMKVWPFTVVAGHLEDWPMIVVQHKGEERQFTPEEISSMVLAKVKETAEVYLGTMVDCFMYTILVLSIEFFASYGRLH